MAIPGYMTHAAPPLKREEELAMIRKLPDPVVAEKLLRHNYPIIHRVAVGFYHRQILLYKTDLPGTNLDDLFQEGCLGFCKALSKFNPDSGNRLATYAVWWIRHYIIRYMRREPEPGDLELDRSKLFHDGKGESLQESFADDDSLSPVEMVSGKERDHLVALDLFKIRKRLGPVGWDIVRFRLMLDKEDPGYLNLREIGRLHCVTRERVRQIEAQIKTFLRHRLQELAV